MGRSSLVTVLAALGGLLVILGGIVGFLLSIGPNGYGPRYDGMVGGLVLGLVAIFLGILILIFSGYTHFQGVDRSLTGGLILVVLGIVTWVVVGDGILVDVGSLLTVVAGLALPFRVLVGDSSRHASTTP